MGLGHSQVQGAVMFPWYFGYRGDGDLPEDDRLAIQQLYGTKNGSKQWGPINPTQRRTHYTHPTTTTTTLRPTRRTYYPDRPIYPNTPRRTENDYPARYPSHPRHTTESTSTTRRYHPHTTHHTHYNGHKNHHHEKPDMCNTAYDAITMIRGEVFIFKGRYMMRIGRDGISNGEWYEIRSLWQELPEDFKHIDTAYENKKRQIVFFIGELFIS